MSRLWSVPATAFGNQEGFDPLEVKATTLRDAARRMRAGLLHHAREMGYDVAEDSVRVEYVARVAVYAYQRPPGSEERREEWLAMVADAGADADTILWDAPATLSSLLV